MLTGLCRGINRTVWLLRIPRFYLPRGDKYSYNTTLKIMEYPFPFFLRTFRNYKKKVYSYLKRYLYPDQMAEKNIKRKLEDASIRV